VVGFTTGSREKVPGKTCEKRIIIIIIIIKIIALSYCFLLYGLWFNHIAIQKHITHAVEKTSSHKIGNKKIKTQTSANGRSLLESPTAVCVLSTIRPVLH
jgi:hypothetical protein